MPSLADIIVLGARPAGSKDKNGQIKHGVTGPGGPHVRNLVNITGRYIILQIKVQTGPVMLGPRGHVFMRPSCDMQTPLSSGQSRGRITGQGFKPGPLAQVRLLLPQERSLPTCLLVKI